MTYTHKIDYKWAILAVASLILFFSMSTRFAFGVTLKPMLEDLGGSRASLSLVMTLFLSLSALALPVVGRLLDRYSAGLVLAGAVVLASAGVGLLGWATSLWQVLLLYGVAFALGNGGTSISPISVLISRWFRDGRGLANGVAIACGAVGQLVVIMLLSALLPTIGWRSAYKVLGLSTLVLTLPIVLTLVRPRSPNYGSPGSGQQHTEGPLSTHQATLPPHPAVLFSPRTALGSHKFLLLVLIYLICGFQDFFVATHIVAFATDQGVGPLLAGNALALMGIMAMMGVLLSGVMADAFGPVRPTALSFLLRIAIFSLIISSQTTPAILAFALLYGFTGFMTAPLVPIFVGRHFGVTQLGTLTGTLNMVHQAAGGLGAFVGGLMFDSFGSYHWVFVLALAMSLVATATSILLRESRASQRA